MIIIPYFDFSYGQLKANYKLVDKILKVRFVLGILKVRFVLGLPHSV